MELVATVMRRLISGLLVASALAGCAGTQPRLEPLSVTLADIRPVQIGLLEQEYAIRIRVQNPNAAAVRIDGLSYQIDLNGEPFAKGVSRQATSVPGFGEVVLDATAVGNLGAILAQVARMQRGGAPEQFSYRLQGKVGSGQTTIPFESQGKVELTPTVGGDR